MKIGGYILGEGNIEINQGKYIKTLKVINKGKTAVRVTSHYPFCEVNRSLQFNRESAFGLHLNLPAGCSILFLPGEEVTVELVKYGGNQEIWGFNNLINGKLDHKGLQAFKQNACDNNFYGGSN